MPKYDIFISYRRDGGEYLSHNIYERFKSLGYSVFYDVESLRQGKFNEALYEIIDECNDFILVLPPKSLDRCIDEEDWVRKEIARAIMGHKNIIPVMMPEFEFPNEKNLPSDISDIVNYNGIKAEAEYFDAFIDKIICFLISKSQDEIESNKNKAKTKKTKIIISCLCVLLAAVIFAVFWGIKKNSADNNQLIVSNIEINSDFDNHIILDLNNANHQYDVGLESWRRLDYIRAERDIKTARDEVSKSVSQAEIELAVINNSLGCLYLDMGKYTEAYDYLNSAYVVFKDTYGSESPEARSALFSIAQYDYYTGDIESAKISAQRIVDSSDEKNDIVILTAVNHFKAMIEENLGSYDEALLIYNKVLTLYGDFVDDDGSIKELIDYVDDKAIDKSEKEYENGLLRRLLTTYNGIGQVYMKKGDYEKAQKILQKALDACLDNIYIGTKNILTAEIYMNIAIAESNLDNYSKALDDIDISMRIEKKLFDYESVYPGLVTVYCTYGNILKTQNNFEEAGSYYEEALKLSESSFGENHPQTAATHNSIGLYYENIGDYSSAANHFTKAIEIQKNILSKKHPDTITYYLNLVDAQICLKMYEAAETNIGEAESICNQINVSDKLKSVISQKKKEIEICNQK